MALSLLTAAFLMSAVRDVSGESVHDLQSITAICTKIQSSAAKLNQQFLSCEPGSCPKGGKTVGKCHSSETKIAFKVQLDGNTLCTERCVKHKGHHVAASTSKPHSAAGAHHGMNDKSMAHDQGAGKSEKSQDSKAAPGKMPMDDKAKKANAGLSTGAKAGTVPADSPETTSQAPTAASSPIAAEPMAVSDAPGIATAPAVAPATEPLACNNIVEALMKLPQAASLAELASKVCT
jgi:hypothetical protein